jgi:hypothetical protein
MTKSKSKPNSKSRVLVVATLVCGALLASAGAAQAPPPSSPVAREKMQALAFLVGEWQGDAWMQMGPDRRETAAQHERVEWKAGGEVLLIQGRGESDGQVVHEAIATITWDARAGRYAMWTYRAGSGAGLPSIEVGDRRVVWGFDVPNGKVRYTISLDPEGRWAEIGDHSSDGGATWNRFFGMTLRKL